MPAMQESHLYSRSPTFCSWTWSVIQKLLVNEEREVMQQTNSSARQHLAMGQLNSIQAAPRVKGPVSGDTAEIPLWRGETCLSRK